MDFDQKELPRELGTTYFFTATIFYERKTDEFFSPSRVVRHLVKKDGQYVYNGYLCDCKNALKLYEDSKKPLAEYNPNFQLPSKYFPEALIKDKVPSDKLIFYYPTTEEDFKLIYKAEQEDKESRKYYKID